VKGKKHIFLSRENCQTRQTCDHIKKHNTMSKRDRAIRFSRRSSPNSILESSTCRAPRSQRSGGLIRTFGNFPDRPCTYKHYHPDKFRCILSDHPHGGTRSVLRLHFILRISPPRSQTSTRFTLELTSSTSCVVCSNRPHRFLLATVLILTKVSFGLISSQHKEMRYQIQFIQVFQNIASPNI
jgi:hypothetical protein